MLEQHIILNERDARRAQNELSRIDSNLSTDALIESTKIGLPTDVIEKHRKAMKTVRSAINNKIDLYKRAKDGDYDDLLSAWRSDPGITLIIARIARGMSQAELADKLGMREQQIQRYEADRYRSINLQNYRRISNALGVELEIKIHNGTSAWIREITAEKIKFTDEQIKKVLEHAKKQQWFTSSDNEDEPQEMLLDYIYETSTKFGSPALLRTGINSLDLGNDLSLSAWRARVIKRAEIEKTTAQFDPINISWLKNLVSLSSYEDGPLRAKNMLFEKGITIIIEPQIAGLRLDGAAFLMGAMPVIGLTIRYDRIDNFWFTLLHELAHIFLHQQAGLSAGFFDDMDKNHSDGIEIEADEFAESMLVPIERWKTAPARIATSATPIENFAKQLNIHPAIVFGRIRKERGNYSIFSDRIGSGEVRNQLMIN